MSAVLIGLVQHLKYIGIFIGTFIEGPAVGLITGFLVKLGYLNLYLGYIAHVFGDFIADFLYFSIGYHGQKRVLGKFSISSNTLNKATRIKKIVNKHPGKIIILGKITHIFGLPVLIGIGLARYPRYKFLLFDFTATLIKSAILIFLGFYLTQLWTTASDIIYYMGLLGIFLLITAAIYFLAKSYKKTDILCEK